MVSRLGAITFRLISWSSARRLFSKSLRHGRGATISSLVLMALLALTMGAFLLGFSPLVSAQAAPTGWVANPPVQVVNSSSISPFVAVTNTQIYQAYGFGQLSCNFTGYPWGDPHLCGYGQTIGIVDAYDDPTLQSDLALFTSLYGLPPCNTTNGCLVKATPQGTPAANSGWDLEISLDVQWAHAIAPGAKIMLVEVSSNSFSNLLTGVSYASSQPGVHQVSMSWGGSEFSSEGSYNSYFEVGGVSFFASSGDSGHGVEWPAASPYVVGVGGTSLSMASNGTVLSETAWADSGGGVSSYLSIPSYQSSFGVNSSGRGVPDVSYDADPNTGFEVYLSGSEVQVGGTSAGSPQWAALFAIVNSYRSTPISSISYGTDTAIYGAASNSTYASNFRDITSGTNGACGAVCTAGPGYDFVTGLGSPLANSLVPFLISNVTSPGMTPRPNVVVGASPTPFSVNVTNPATASSNLTQASFFVPAGWTLGGTSTPPSGWSLASNSSTMENFTSASGLRPGSSAIFSLGNLTAQNSTGSPVAELGTFATTVAFGGSVPSHTGPQFSVYSIAPTNVTVTISPTTTSYPAGLAPYTINVTLGSGQSGVPVLFSAPGYGASTAYNITPASGYTGASGSLSTTFQPSEKAGNATTVVAALGTSALNSSSPLITTVANVPYSVVFELNGSAFPSIQYMTAAATTSNASGSPPYTFSGAFVPGSNITLAAVDAFGNVVPASYITNSSEVYSAVTGIGLFDAPGFPSSVKGTYSAIWLPLPADYYQSGAFGTIGNITLTLNGTYTPPGGAPVNFTVVGSTGSLETSLLTFTVPPALWTSAGGDGVQITTVAGGMAPSVEVQLPSYGNSSGAAAYQSNVPVTLYVQSVNQSAYNYTGTFSNGLSSILVYTNGSGIAEAVLDPDQVAGHAAYFIAAYSDPIDANASQVVNSSESAAVTTVSNSVYLTVEGMDGLIYSNALANSSWSGWQALPSGTTVNTPAVAAYGGYLYFVVEGSSPANSLYFGYQQLSNGSFSGWTQLPGASPFRPALAVGPNGTLYLVVSGTDGGIYLNTYNGTWSGWAALPGSTPGAPAVAVVGGILHVVVEGISPTNSIYDGEMNLTSDAWLGWTELVGSTSSPPSLAVDPITGTLFLAVRGMDGGVYVASFRGGSWSGWTPVTSGSTPASPAIVVANGSLYLFVVGYSPSNSIYYSSMDIATGTWSGWAMMSGASPSPSAATYG